jgi:hypothetical protein
MPMSARENNLSEAGALLAGIARGTGHHKLASYHDADAFSGVVAGVPGPHYIPMYEVSRDRRHTSLSPGATAD